jgi:hypothetical protein
MQFDSLAMLETKTSKSVEMVSEAMMQVKSEWTSGSHMRRDYEPAPRDAGQLWLCLIFVATLLLPTVSTYNHQQLIITSHHGAV